MDTKNGMRPVASGRNPARGTGHARAVGQCAGPGAWRAGEPDHAALARPAGGDRRYGAAAGAVFRDHAAAVAESTADLGAPPGGAGDGSRDRCAGPAPAAGGVAGRKKRDADSTGGEKRLPPHSPYSYSSLGDLIYLRREKSMDERKQKPADRRPGGSPRQDPYGWTPLYLADTKDHEAVVARLLDAGATLHRRDPYGETPLHWAAAGGHETVVASLLDAGATLNPQDLNGETPLHRAAAAGHEAVVKCLLDAGATPQSPGQEGLDAAALGC